MGVVQVLWVGLFKAVTPLGPAVPGKSIFVTISKVAIYEWMYSWKEIYPVTSRVGSR